MSHLSYDPMVAVAVSALGGGPTCRVATRARPPPGKRGSRPWPREGVIGPAVQDAKGGFYIAYPLKDWLGGAYSAVVRGTG